MGGPCSGGGEPTIRLACAHAALRCSRPLGYGGCLCRADRVVHAPERGDVAPGQRVVAPWVVLDPRQGAATPLRARWACSSCMASRVVTSMSSLDSTLSTTACRPGCKPGHGVRHGLGIGEEHGFVRAQHQHAWRAFACGCNRRATKSRVPAGGPVRWRRAVQSAAAPAAATGPRPAACRTAPPGPARRSGCQRHPGVTVPAQRGPQRARPQLVRDDADHDRAQHRQGSSARASWASPSSRAIAAAATRPVQRLRPPAS